MTMTTTKHPKRIVTCVLTASLAILANAPFHPAEAVVRAAPQAHLANEVLEDQQLNHLERVQLLEDVGASERINFSGKLRMLTQRLANAACYVHAGVATEEAQVLLSASGAEFDKIVNALEFGDEELGIKGVEERRKTLVVLKALKEGWAPFFEAVKALQSDASDAEAMAYIAEMNLPLLERAKLLVSELSGQYSNPTEMLQSDVISIDIAGRQRMLTQKMSKEACGIETANSVLGTVEALGGTMNVFEASLFALRDGLPAAGLNPPKNPEIKAQLDIVVSHWTAVRSRLDPVQAGAKFDETDQVEIMKGLNVTMKDMNVAVGMYTSAAKLGL